MQSRGDRNSKRQSGLELGSLRVHLKEEKPERSMERNLPKKMHYIRSVERLGGGFSGSRYITNNYVIIAPHV